jgi:putative ABC transport system ATP-binding protein
LSPRRIWIGDELRKRLEGHRGPVPCGQPGHDRRQGRKGGILGRSGSGKSTLLSILGLLATQTAGSYLFDGQDVARLGTRRRDGVRARTFGFIFQRFCLMPHLTAAENVEVALLHQGIRHRRGKALRALADVGLAERAGHRPAQLSGGEQQRVALARALVIEPAVILADEPTGSLDEETGASMMALLHALTAQRGTSMVVVTHDPIIVGSFHRTVVLEKGRLVTA